MRAQSATSLIGAVLTRSHSRSQTQGASALAIETLALCQLLSPPVALLLPLCDGVFTSWLLPCLPWRPKVHSTCNFHRKREKKPRTLILISSPWVLKELSIYFLLAVITQSKIFFNSVAVVSSYFYTPTCHCAFIKRTHLLKISPLPNASFTHLTRLCRTLKIPGKKQ